MVCIRPSSTRSWTRCSAGTLPGGGEGHRAVAGGVCRPPERIHVTDLGAGSSLGLGNGKERWNDRAFGPEASTAGAAAVPAGAAFPARNGPGARHLARHHHGLSGACCGARQGVHAGRLSEHPGDRPGRVGGTGDPGTWRPWKGLQRHPARHPRTHRQRGPRAFIDGHHDREATLGYFEHVLARSHEGTVLVFDDIHWSPECPKPGHASWSTPGPRSPRTCTTWGWSFCGRTGPAAFPGCAAEAWHRYLRVKAHQG